VRPSGTEPKIKYYISVQAALATADKFEEVSSLLDHRIARLTEQLQKL
jgi:phosphoglucomutase